MEATVRIKTADGHGLGCTTDHPVVRRTFERGMTLIELMVVLLIIGVLAAIAVAVMHSRIDKARLARCMNELRSIQSTVFVHSDGSTLPDQNTFWQTAWNGLKPGPYFYLTDAEDPNCGHGNDLDGFDEQNPGNAPRERRDIHFVLLCQHDHKDLAWYVYLEDEGPPLISWNGSYPGYHRFIHGNHGGGNSGGGGTGGGTPGGGNGGGNNGGGNGGGNSGGGNGRN
jgi:prepilin-type N-terminal cleavage/methylation domain-containing protein